MSMVFAGFMGAAKEDRIRREDLKNEQDKEERSWQKQLDLLDITDRKQQEIIDRKLGKEAAAFAKMTGSSYEEAFDAVTLYGGAGASTMYMDGSLKFNGIKDSLSSTESNGNPSAFRTNKDGESYGGVFQMGQLRLTDYNRIHGTNWTPETYTASSVEEQKKVSDWHFADIDRVIHEEGFDKLTGKMINGVPVTVSGLTAVAHLGGVEGMKKFVRTNGTYNVQDELGTSLTEYLETHGGKTTDTAYAPEGFNLDDAKANPADSKVAFGEDSQMNDLGFAGLSMGEEPMDATLSTKGELTAGTTDVPDPSMEPEATGFSLVKTEADLSEYIKGANSLADVETRIREVQVSNKLTPAAKEAIITQLTEHGEVLKSLDDQGTKFDPDNEVSSVVAAIGSMDDLLSARAALLGDSRIPAEKRDAALAQLDQLQTQFTELAVTKAEQGGTPLTFVPRGSNGMFAAGQAQTVRKEGGQWVDIGTGQPIDETQGRLLPVDSAADVVKQYNDEIDEIAITVSNGANGARDLLLYRDLVQKNPAAVNKYSNILGSLLGEVESAFSAGESWLKADGSYDYGFVDRRLNALQDLTDSERQIAEAQLGAALAVASASGSSGRDLSDNDLKLALQRVGAGISNPEKLVGLLNQQVSRLMQSIETQRSARVDSFLTDNATAGGFQSTPFGMPFSDYLSTQLTDEQKVQLQSALADDRTVGEVEATVPPDEPQQQSSTGYAPVTPALIAQDARLAPYQGRQIKFVRRNGKVVIDVLPDASTARGQR